MLEHECGAGSIANRAAMRAAIGQRIHRVIALLQGFEEVQITIGIVEDRQIDEARAVISAEHVIGIFLRINTCCLRACIYAGCRIRLVIEIRVHFILKRPALCDDCNNGKNVFWRFGIVIGLCEKLRFERGVEQFCLLLLPRQICDRHPAGPEGEGVHRALPRHDDAIAAQGDLRDDVRAIVIFRAHSLDLLVKRQFLGDGLERREGNEHACLAA